MEFWEGSMRAASASLAAGAAASGIPGGEHERADCVGKLALVEALCGRLNRAVDLTADVAAPGAE